MASKITKREMHKRGKSRKKPEDLRPRLKKAAKILNECSTSSLDDDTLCAKSLEVAAKLLSQCCIIGLQRAKGWYNTDIAKGLSKKGAHASRDMIGQWLNGKTTPEPDRLAALDELYRSTPNYRSGRLASIRFQVGD